VFGLVRQNISGAMLFQLVAELSWLFSAILLILHLDGRQPLQRLRGKVTARSALRSTRRNGGTSKPACGGKQGALS